MDHKQVPLSHPLNDSNPRARPIIVPNEHLSNTDDFAHALTELGVSARVLPPDPATPLSMKYYRH